jgi:hypothetical protein
VQTQPQSIHGEEQNYQAAMEKLENGKYRLFLKRSSTLASSRANGATATCKRNKEKGNLT